MKFNKKDVKYLVIFYFIFFLIIIALELVLRCVEIKSLDRRRLNSIFPGGIDMVEESHNFDPDTGIPLCVPDRELFWKMAPNRSGNFEVTKNVVTNSLGFRSPEFSARKPRGTYRIICLGDSATFGMCVRQDETVQALLQKHFRDTYPSRDMEVINTGVPGYTSQQGRVTAQQYLEKFKPDLITFAFGINDLTEAIMTQADWYRMNTNLSGRLIGFFHKSELYTLFEYLVISLRDKIISFLVDEQARAQRVPHRVPIADFEDNLKYVAELCKSKGVDLVIIREAVKKEPWLSDRLAKMDQQLEIMHRVAADNNAFVLDLWEVMENVQEAAPGKPDAYHPFFADHFHPNGKGNELIAAELFRKIQGVPSFKAFLRK